MHIPDGFLADWICVVLLLASLLAVLLSLRAIRHSLTREAAAKYAVLAAAIFAAQMLNFPIAEGTSGHFLGVALAVMLFGLNAAVFIISVVLAIQAVAFGDGGMLALGANIFSMAIVGGCTAHFAYKATSNSFIASWISVVASSVACAILLGLSGTAAMIPALIAMASIHAVIGVGEGIISSAALACARSRIASRLPEALAAGACFFALAMLLPFVSAEPDGLESVAINLGFYESAVTLYDAPFPEYMLPLADEYLAALLAGLVGMVLAAVAVLAVMEASRVSAAGAAYHKE